MDGAGKSESFPREVVRNLGGMDAAPLSARAFARNAHRDVFGLGENEFAQFEIDPAEIEVTQEVPGHFVREGFDQFILAPGNEAPRFLADLCVIDRAREVVAELGKGMPRLQGHRDREPLRLRALFCRHADPRQKFQLLYTDLVGSHARER